MEMHLNFQRFGDKLLELVTVDMSELQKINDERKRLFERIVFQTTNSEEIEDISTGELLEIIENADYYMGGSPLWEERIYTIQQSLQATKSVRLKRYLKVL